MAEVLKVNKTLKKLELGGLNEITGGVMDQSTDL